MVEIIAKEQNKGKGKKRIEKSLRDLWDNIKCTNIRLIGVPKEEEKGNEKIFEEIIVENFSNMVKEIFHQVQEAQRVPYRLNPRRNTLRHINQANRVKYKERILKEARGKQVRYKGKPIQLTVDLQQKLYRPKGNGRIYLKFYERKTYNHDYYTQQRSHSELTEKSKALWTSRS